jgi:hypothetical protein
MKGGDDIILKIISIVEEKHKNIGVGKKEGVFVLPRLRRPTSPTKNPGKRRDWMDRKE